MPGCVTALLRRGSQESERVWKLSPGLRETCEDYPIRVVRSTLFVEYKVLNIIDNKNWNYCSRLPRLRAAKKLTAISPWQQLYRQLKESLENLNKQANKSKQHFRSKDQPRVLRPDFPAYHYKATSLAVVQRLWIWDYSQRQFRKSLAWMIKASSINRYTVLYRYVSFYSIISSSLSEATLYPWKCSTVSDTP